MLKRTFAIIPIVAALSACQITADKITTDPQLPELVTVSEMVELTPSNTSVLIIDAQQGYVMGSPDFWIDVWYPNLEQPVENVDPLQAEKIDNIATIAKAANRLGFTTNITYEAYNTEFGLDYSPFIESIKQELPASTGEFFKGYFDSTKEADINAAMQALLDQGISNIVVSGAETDVCVMQTILGLRKMGFNVYFASDATFSTEMYNRHVFKRLQQAGVNLATTDEIIESMTAADEMIYSPRYAIAEREQLHKGDRRLMAAVHFNMDQDSLAMAEHDNLRAIEYRTYAWTLEQEYMFSQPNQANMPNYHVSAQLKAFSSGYPQPVNLKTVDAIATVVSDMQQAGKTQAVLTGVVGEQELIDAVLAFTNAGITPIIIEDNLRGREVDPIHFLDTAYNLGAVPSSHKSTGYEMYEAVQLADFSEAEKGGYYARIDSGKDQTIPELYPRLR
ncbi:isochorismatase family protein [Salinibius halmophilus]|uniref:isochorismatase family protein n=1 Tax=Salinibius halmophilus TaxID=1853216 RepID=UPI000E661095|nr:isochorismatase family protein [Salinibius halmophilus]